MKCCSKSLPSYDTTCHPDPVVCTRCLQYAVVEQLDNDRSMYVTYSLEPYRTFSNKVLHVVDCTKSDEFRNVWIRVQSQSKKSSKIATANIELPEITSDYIKAGEKCGILSDVSADSSILHEYTYETNTSVEDGFNFNEQFNETRQLCSKVNEQCSIIGEQSKEIVEESNPAEELSQNDNEHSSHGDLSENNDKLSSEGEKLSQSELSSQEGKLLQKVDEQSSQDGELFQKGNEQASITEEFSLEANSSKRHSKRAIDERSYDIKDLEKLKLPKCSVKLVKHNVADLHLYSFLSKHKAKEPAVSFTGSINNLNKNDIKAAILSSSMNMVLSKNLEEIIATSSKKRKMATHSFKSKKVQDETPAPDVEGSVNSTSKRKKNTDLEQESDGSYEDDIYENQTIRMPDFLEEDSDTEGSVTGMETPKFEYSVSPEQDSSSPAYEDCYSPTELNALRKEAEQYNSRRKKRKMHSSSEKESGLYEEMKKQASSGVSLSEVYRILSEKNLKEKSSDEEEEMEDNYFSDSSMGNLL